MIVPLVVLFSAYWSQVTCINMIGGTDLPANPYSETVLIQKKPATTICFGVIQDERTVYTSTECDVGSEPVGNYHVLEMQLYNGPPPAKSFAIEKIVRGSEKPFDVKAITLVEPILCENCSTAKIPWVEEFDDYSERMRVRSPAVVLSFGPPFKGGIVTYNNDNCRQEYDKVKEEMKWPANFPLAGFCITRGTEAIDLQIGEKPKPVKTEPGDPCDDSIGSPVKVNDYGRSIGFIIKGFCGNNKVAFSFASYLFPARHIVPDGWTPPTTTTTTTSNPQSTPEGPGSAPMTGDRVINLSIRFFIHVILIIDEML